MVEEKDIVRPYSQASPRGMQRAFGYAWGSESSKWWWTGSTPAPLQP